MGYLQLCTIFISYMEADMDWKIEQQRREKKQAVGKIESSRNVNILGEMEREFAQIFGGSANSVFVNRCRKAGDPVRRAESFRQPSKGAKTD